MAKVYVAGSSKDIQRVQKAIAMLEAGGHEITHDWTQTVGRPPSEYEVIASDDLDGVYDAEVLLLINHQDGFGSMTEFGMALAWGRPVIVVDREARVNIFFNLSDVFHYKSLDAAVQAIGEWEWHEHHAPD